MIIKGGAAGNVGFWSGHLQRDDTNDRAEVMEISGLLATNLPTALREMEAIAAQSRSGGNFMYQANINPRDGERLTEPQWKEAVDTLENHLGLHGHQRVVVEHEKAGRVHRHVVWNRVDVETLHIKDIGGNYYTHERVARTLEVKFDLQRTASLHSEKRPEGRPDRAEELWQHRAAERSGIDPKQVTSELTDLWRKTDSGKAFAAALEERGYILAQGDRRNFCIVDQAGDAHSLSRRIEGAKVKDLRERLAGIDAATLPTVDGARAAQREKYPTHEAARTAWEGRAGAAAPHAPRQEQTPPQEPQKAAAQEQLRQKRDAERSAIDQRRQVKAELTELWRKTDSGKAFAAAAEERGYILAQGVSRNFWIVDQAGDKHSLARRIDGAKAKDVRERLAGIDPASLPTVDEARAAQREKYPTHEAAREAWEGRAGAAAHAPEREQTAQQEPHRPATGERPREAPREKWHDRAATTMEGKIFRIQEIAERGGVSVAAALHSEGITLARVDAAGKDGVQRDYQQKFEAARDAGKDDARLRRAAFKEGELVAVTRYGDVHRLNPQFLDIDRLERAATGGDRDPAPRLSDTLEFFATDRASPKAGKEATGAEISEKREQTNDFRAAAREATADTRATPHGRADAVRDTKEAVLTVTDGATGAVSSLSSFVETLLNMAGGAAPPPTKGDMEIRQQRRALAAMEDIRDCIERGESLRASDVSHLTPSHLANLKLRGDDYMRELIENLERGRERQEDYGRTREQ